jgi:hypothetical protein
LAFPHDSYLLFPLEKFGDDKMIKKFAFSDVKKTIIERIEELISSEAFQQQINSGTGSKTTSIQTSLMKAICYSKGWVDKITFSSGSAYSCRILIIKMSKEDHSQYSSFVNSIFAA